LKTSSEDLRRRVSEVAWYHTIDLGDGIVTPGATDSRARLPQLGMPADLSGRTVLDIGAWDGFYSFEAERRGAERVLAVDRTEWIGEGWPSGKQGFELAREALGSKVEDRVMDVYELSPETVGRFDLVLFLGVLYHLRDPLPALERVASVTADQLILETHVDLSFVHRPAMAFYPGQELSHDPTNWWGPNSAAVVAMLRAVGFGRVKTVSPTSLRYRAGRGLYRLLRGALRPRWNDGPPLQLAQQGRLVVHAWR
jgi:tRNA (mo5U34)-methyltransferase